MSESEEEPDYSDMEESEEDEQSDFEGDPTAELDSRRVTQLTPRDSCRLSTLLANMRCR